MSAFRLLLAVLAACLVGALGWAVLAADPGQVFVRYRGWDLETTVPNAVLVLVAVSVAAWLLALALMLPLRWWRRHRHRRNRARFVDGLLALDEGRWSRAEALLQRAASDPRLRVPARLMAARAAHSRGDDAAAQAHFAALDAEPLKPAQRNAADLAAAWRAWERGDADGARSRLDAIAARGRLPPRALQLHVEVLARLGRHDDACARLPALRASKVMDDAAFARLESDLHTRALAAAPDGTALSRHWDSIAKPLRLDPGIVTAYTQRAAALGREDDALDALGRALDSRWSEELAVLYGVLPAGRVEGRLATAEGWLAAHHASPALLVTLGRLCRRRALWGKAEDYLHRAIAQGAGSDAWEVLGDVLAFEGDDARARLSYANALRVARSEASEELPGRALRQKILDEAVAEERDAHGVPRLPLSPPAAGDRNPAP